MKKRTGGWGVGGETDDPLFTFVDEGKDVKFCTRAEQTCRNLQSQIFICLLKSAMRCEFQTLQKFQPINIRYLSNTQFFKENGS